MSVVGLNGSAADALDEASTGSSVLVAPVREDGTVYRYEMLYAGLTRRAYSDDPTDLLTLLVPGYADQDEDEQWESRLHLATRVQVLAQATLNEDDALNRVSSQQREILQGSRHEPPVVPHWDCAVPLVLVSTFYAPAGKIPRPSVSAGMEPNVIWINPSDELTLLESLHDVGAIALHEAVEE